MTPAERTPRREAVQSLLDSLRDAHRRLVEVDEDDEVVLGRPVVGDAVRSLVVAIADLESYCIATDPGEATNTDIAPATADTSDDELLVRYQPRISLTTGRIVGFEASLHADERVLLEACTTGALWQRSYPACAISMTIKVLADAVDADFGRSVRAAVSTSGIDPATIWLELTEPAATSDVEQLGRVLAELNTDGIRASVAGSGRSLSTLAYLHRLPVGAIKIDRAFVHGLGGESADTAIVASIVNLAHAMNCEAIADDVVTSDQLKQLRALGCDTAQGPLIARPLDAAEVDDYLIADTAGDRWPRPSSGRHPEVVARDRCVLVVDDAADIRMLASMTLTAAGFKTHEAGSAHAAIGLARRLRPDAVLLDINMPDMSGIEVCRNLRSDPHTADCTIVMLTSRSEGVSKAEAFLMGADDYIVKPFTPRELTSRLHDAIRRRQQTIDTARPADPALYELLRDAQRKSGTEPGDALNLAHFSDRQLEIVRRLLAGERVPGIAKHLFVSQSTVRNHLSAIFRRVGVSSQEELLLHLRSGDEPRAR